MFTDKKIHKNIDISIMHNDLIVENLGYFLNINVFTYLNRILSVRPRFLVPVCILSSIRLCKLPIWFTDFFLVKNKKTPPLFQSPTKCPVSRKAPSDKVVIFCLKGPVKHFTFSN
jgi:hypothetical protein